MSDREHTISSLSALMLKLEQQIAALTAELELARTTEHGAVKYAAHLEERNEALTAERDQLRAYLASRPTTAERDQLRAALKAVEWASYGCHCPECHKRESIGHAPDCIVGMALGGGK